MITLTFLFIQLTKSLLYCINQSEIYTELSRKEMIKIMLAYVRKMNFTKEQLAGVSSAMTGTTAKRLIEWGMIYEFAL